MDAIGGGGIPVEGEIGPVGHLEDVRHVGGGRNVQNRHLDAVNGKEVEDGGHQGAGMQDRGFSRFEPDVFQPVSSAGGVDEPCEAIAIVSGVTPKLRAIDSNVSPGCTT